LLENLVSTSPIPAKQVSSFKYNIRHVVSSLILLNESEGKSEDFPGMSVKMDQIEILEKSLDTVETTTETMGVYCQVVRNLFSSPYISVRMRQLTIRLAKKTYLHAQKILAQKTDYSDKIAAFESVADAYSIQMHLACVYDRDPTLGLLIAENGRSLSTLEIVKEKNEEHPLESMPQFTTLSQIKRLADESGAFIIYYALFLDYVYIWVIPPRAEIQVKSSDRNSKNFNDVITTLTSAQKIELDPTEEESIKRSNALNWYLLQIKKSLKIDKLMNSGKSLFRSIQSCIVLTHKDFIFQEDKGIIFSMRRLEPNQDVGALVRSSLRDAQECCYNMKKFRDENVRKSMNTFTQFEDDDIKHRVSNDDTAFSGSLKGKNFKGYQQRFNNTMEELYSLLIAPIEEHLPIQSDQKIIICPHRELMVMPFTALHDKKSNVFFIDKYQDIPISLSLKMIHVNLMQLKNSVKYRIERDRKVGYPKTLFLIHCGEDLENVEKEVKEVYEVFIKTVQSNSLLKINRH
jgi:CHAT domain-containing protein